MRSRKWFFAGSVVVLSSLLSWSVMAADQPKEAGTRCHLSFYLESWSVFYRTGKGEGKITCDNGQTADVRIKTHGGGVTFGKQRREGTGVFSKVWDVKETFGGYAYSEAHAGTHASAGAQALWNGRVSLALSGTGQGWDLGIAFGKFKIVAK